LRLRRILPRLARKASLTAARVKLFQIEEPDGGPVDPRASGAAVGIDAAGARAEVGFSVGGNALVLDDRDGFERALVVPGDSAGMAAWQEFFEGARLRAERALARPVSDAVIVLAAPPDGRTAASIMEAAAGAGLGVLRLVGRGELSVSLPAALAAAMLAEDLAPRLGFDAPDAG
jgi:hypothetical protein